jgi:phosphoglycolate phosphatase-like HAD superfamily hydrolase
MTALFIEHLGAENRDLVRDAIWRGNGRPTIFQMEWLAGELRRRGAPAAEPEEYHAEYRRRLATLIEQRLAGDRERLLVHGARALLEALRARGLLLHLVSGTEEDAVRREAELLGIAHFFDGRIHGATEDSPPNLKQQVIGGILRDHSLPGNALLAFGDGEVETRCVREVGGLPVAVASDEAHNGSGNVDAEKRARLLAAGALVVIPDYRDADAILETLIAHEP